MSKKQSCKELSSLEKLYILLKPYIRRREIKEVFCLEYIFPSYILQVVEKVSRSH